MRALLVAGALFGAVTLYERPGPLREAKAIVVPHGSLTLTASALQQAAALPSGRAAALGLRLAARLSRANGPVRAGEFVFPARASLRDLLIVLRTGRPVQHELTIPEGLTAAQIARLLEADGLTGPVPVMAEGSILPQTYAYTYDTSRAALAGRMQQAMQRRLAEIWASRTPGLGLPDPGALVALASLVERETAVAAERPMVARVFLNRLRLGMRLQSDPTVAYAASGGLGALSRPLSRADLGWANPYNTYVAAGLPPGPICAPGEAAMQAVAHPADGDALYFVATGDGGHAFAAALPDHLRNVARLRAREAASEAVP